MFHLQEGSRGTDQRVLGHATVACCGTRPHPATSPTRTGPAQAAEARSNGTETALGARASATIQPAVTATGTNGAPSRPYGDRRQSASQSRQRERRGRASQQPARRSTGRQGSQRAGEAPPQAEPRRRCEAFAHASTIPISQRVNCLRGAEGPRREPGGRSAEKLGQKRGRLRPADRPAVRADGLGAPRLGWCPSAAVGRSLVLRSDLGIPGGSPWGGSPYNSERRQRWTN